MKYRFRDVELENSDNRMKMEMSHHMSTKYEIMKDHHQIIAESCVVPFSNRHSIICTAIIVIVVMQMWSW